MLNGMGGKEYASGVISSLAYLRDRGGVEETRPYRPPRSSAWAIGKILDTQDS